MAEGSITVKVDASYVRHLIDSVAMELAATPVAQRHANWHAHATVQLQTLAVEADVLRHERDELLRSIGEIVGELRAIKVILEGERAAA